MNKTLPKELNEVSSDPAVAVKQVEDYVRYMSTQIDFAIRNISAKNVYFDNSDSTEPRHNLESKNVEDAIKELARR